MFRIIATLGIFGTLAVAATFRVIRGQKLSLTGRKDVCPMSFWETLIYMMVMLSIVALGATGFYATIVKGRQMGGLTLMAHVSAGGVFFTALAAMLIRWAEDCRLLDGDWRALCGNCLGRRGKKGETAPAGRFTAGQKFYFWGLAILGLVATLTMLVSMLPIFGTHGQELLYKLHRLSTLLIVMGALCYGLGRLFRK